MRIAFLDPTLPNYTVETPFQAPIGGSQSALCYLAIELAALGHDVATVTETKEPGRFRGVDCVGPRPGLGKDFLWGFDVLVILNYALGIEIRRVLGPDMPVVLWTQHADDQPAMAGLAKAAERDAWTGFALISGWQVEQFRRRFGLPVDRTVILRNAMSPAFAGLPARAGRAPGDPPLFAYTSTPFRGLDVLLDAWPFIRGALPGARLQVFSSMAVYHQGGERDGYAGLYQRCRATPGVEYIGSLAQPDLARALHRVDALTYPSTFAETSCIAAIEALAAGCLVFTTDLGALRETTAGFARLLPVPSAREHLAEAFGTMVANDWRSASANPVMLRARIEAQREFLRRNATWPVRAPEWLAFLARVVAARA